MVRVIDSSSKNSVNSRDMNSPALSRWRWPAIRNGSGFPTLPSALSLATKERTLLRASLFLLRK